MESKEFPIIYKEVTEAISKSPGWVPLSILCYVVIKASTLQKIDKWFSDNYELSIGIIVLALYTAGDILDRTIFPRFDTKSNRWTGWNWITDKKSIDETRLKIQTELEVKSGIYKVCKLISEGIDTPSAYRIRIENELAKFFRSLIIPLVFYGAWKIYSSNLYFGICCILVSIIFIKVYGSLKGSHMIRLYKRVAKLVAEKKSYEAILLNERIRLHLWDGKLLTSSRIER